MDSIVCSGACELIFDVLSLLAQLLLVLSADDDGLDFFDFVMMAEAAKISRLLRRSSEIMCLSFSC